VNGACSAQIFPPHLATCHVAAGIRQDGEHPSLLGHVWYAVTNHHNTYKRYCFAWTPQPLRLDVKVRGRKQIVANLHQTAALVHGSMWPGYDMGIILIICLLVPVRHRSGQHRVTTVLLAVLRLFAAEAIGPKDRSRQGRRPTPNRALVSTAAAVAEAAASKH
jgi:hypothetical protein